MALDARKRQKKIEKRNAKQKERQREHARRVLNDPAQNLRTAASAPILHSCVDAITERTGLGAVHLSRDVGAGRVAFASFLVDMYCMGVKDAYYGILPRGEYEDEVYGSLSEHAELQRVAPAYLRKLVEGAAAYAHALGFAPHSDYHKAKVLFGDIDIRECAQEFEYGQEGKPCFVAGPNDTPARCDQILRTLQRTQGSNFHFVLDAPIGPEFDGYDVFEDD